MIRRCQVLLALPALLALTVLTVLTEPALALALQKDGPLHRAAVRGDLPELERLLAEGTPVDTPGRGGGNALLQALMYGDQITPAKRLEIVDLLIRHGTDVDFRFDPAASGWDFTALHLAATRSSAPIIKRLVAAGADVNAVDFRGSSVLHHMLHSGLEEEEFADALATLVAAGLDLDAVGPEDETPLLLAARLRPWAVDDLIAVGADVEVTGARGLGPLHVVVGVAKPEIPAVPVAMTALLEAGADVNARDHSNRTPLHVVTPKSVSITRRLIAAGANVNAVDSSGSNALSAVLRMRRYTDEELSELLALMVAAGLEVDARGAGDETLLHLAARVRPSAVDDLIAVGADVNVRNAQGQTPLHLASALYERNEPAMPGAVTALLDAGADIEARDARNKTPLVTASPGSTRILLARGASLAGSPAPSPESTTQRASAPGPTDGEPPLHAAARDADMDRIEQLLAAGADPRARWNGRRAVDSAYGGLRKNFSTYRRAQSTVGGRQYLAVIDRLIAAGGAAGIDELAGFLGMHPAQLRSFRSMSLFLGLIYSPPLALALVAAVFGALSPLRRRRWGRATALGAALSFLGTAFLFWIGTLWMADEGWAAAQLVLPLVALGWVAAVFQLAVWWPLAYRWIGRRRAS
jgi:ankyrin repeat protein